MATTATNLTSTLGGPKSFDMDIVQIVWEGTDATEEVDTNLSEIYGAFGGGVLFGADAGHTDDDCGLIEIDETVTNGVITVDADGQITVNRIATNAAGTLAGQRTTIVLIGKS